MSIQDASFRPIILSGLSTDTKPTVWQAPGNDTQPVPSRSTFIEIDTGVDYVYTGAKWIEPLPDEDFWQAVGEGLIPGHSHVHKFGRHLGIGTSYAPICIGGIWRTPQVSGATALRVKAGNANDTVDGSGARRITIEVLDETGVLIQEEIPTAGESAGAASTVTALRFLRAWVSESGTYATVTSNSHAAAIVIENAAGNEDWGTIDFGDSVGRGQTEIGCYAVELGKTAFITNVNVSADSTKVTEFLLFQRRNILQTVAPYSSFRTIEEFGGVAGEGGFETTIPLGPFPALTDLMMLGKSAAGSPECDIDFEIMLEDEL